MFFIQLIVLLAASTGLPKALRPVTSTPEDAAAPASGDAQAAGQLLGSFVQKPEDESKDTNNGGKNKQSTDKNGDEDANSENGEKKKEEDSGRLQADVKKLEDDAEKALEKFETDELEFEHWEAGRLFSVIAVYSFCPLIGLLFYICFCRNHAYGRYDTFATGLFDCWGDSRICLCAFLCPCLRWADTVSKEKAGLINFFLAFFMFLMLVITVRLSVAGWWIGSMALTVLGTIYRQKLRATYGLTSWTPGSIFSDFWAWFCCLWCAVAQEARHVEWFEGEVERLTEARGVMPPPPAGKLLKEPVSEVMTEPNSKDTGETAAEADKQISAKASDEAGTKGVEEVNPSLTSFLRS